MSVVTGQTVGVAAQRVGMWGSDDFVDRAIAGLQNLVNSGKLPAPVWNVEGPHKLPLSDQGAAARYATEVDGHNVELRRYWPYSVGKDHDSFDWCFAISVERDGVVLGWAAVDAGSTALAKLVESVVKLIEPQVEAGRRGFLGAVAEQREL